MKIYIQIIKLSAGILIVPIGFLLWNQFTSQSFQSTVERSKVYSADQGWLNLGPDLLDLREAAEADAVTGLRQEACRYGILERARQQAIAAIAQLTGLQAAQITMSSGVCQ